MGVDRNRFEVVIAGAGPAGSSAAIHLAQRGVNVLLVEQKRFPRQKLCGEFISPECREHFKRLGVAADMDSALPATLSETVFYSLTGHRISVPSEWLTSNSPALGLSRAEMDYNLLKRAASLGVTVLQDASVVDVLEDANHVRGVRVKLGEVTMDYESSIVIDATGRTRALIRKSKSRGGKRFHAGKSRLIAFKVHLQNTRGDKSACEIYSYRGGYGGLSSIEDGLSNLCFIVAARDVRRCFSDPAIVMDKVVKTNPRAAYALADARICGDWLSVALEGFGRETLVPLSGLLTVGDAAAFIDPFTGSGMLMAFESGELAATTICRHLKTLSTNLGYVSLTRDYRSAYARKFDSRLRISGLLRRTAFVPFAAEAAILFFSLNDRLRRKLARSTRSPDQPVVSAQ
ncbi:MAG TPA: NAD(P)/FAD-dependent oxidoreductase [Pyrinomonadaceae bacterium]